MSMSLVALLPMIKSMREISPMPLAVASARFTLTATPRNEKSSVSVAATVPFATSALLRPPSSRPVSDAVPPITRNTSAELPPIRFSMLV